MVQSAFMAAAWGAISEVEDHFATMGGRNQYAGYDDAQSAVLVIAVLAAQAAKFRFAPTEAGIRAALDLLEPEAPQLCRLVRSVEPWNPERFPDALLSVVHQRIGGHHPTAADVLALRDTLVRRLSSLTARERSTIEAALRELATLCSSG